MKTAISLPDDLFQEADAFASEHGLSRSELYATALKDYLRTHNASHITEQINAVCEKSDTSLPADLKAHTLRQLREVKW